MRSRIPFLSLLVLGSLFLGMAQAQFRYVKSGGVGDGLSWGTAAGDLQAAIDSLGGQSGGILVAAGTYKPGVSGFLVAAPVEFFGGFPADASSATSMLDRDPWTHRTILSGDLAGNDEVDLATGLPIVGTMDENACRVLDVQNLGVGDAVVVDGFLIEGGNANNDTGPNRPGGGGIRVIGQNGYRGNYGSFILRDCELRRNLAGNDGYSGASGGGLMTEYVDVELENCRVFHNLAGNGKNGADGAEAQMGEGGSKGGDGGGIAVRNADNAVFDRVLFKGNVAGRGGDGGAGGESGLGGIDRKSVV